MTLAMEWEDKGYRHVITKHGHYCGYVGVGPDHPWFGRRDYDDLGVEVHGGLTFAGEAKFGAGLWWFGFDTAHIGDEERAIDLPYMVRQVKKLSLQIKEADA